MKLLLLAYEFPPIVAAQSLRWYYLVNELIALGAEIHVICPNMPALCDYPNPVRPEAFLHRSFSGPYVGFSQLLARKLNRHDVNSQKTAVVDPGPLLKMHRAGRRIADNLLYPDLRTEWFPFAVRDVIRLLNQHTFDAVISSYEPGVDILLGLWARAKKELPWIIDLGDPILSPYSPKWRRSIDKRFERFILRKADAVVTTTDRAKSLLIARHSIPEQASKFFCIPQGHPSRQTVRTTRSSGPMKIVYTGSFYRDFRNPSEFALALKAVEDLGITFLCFGNNHQFKPMFNGIRGVEFMGVRDHFECLEMQAEADLLLSIANDQDYQIPGKLYEYIGSAAPLLHLGNATNDESALLIDRLAAGWVTRNRAQDIEAKLREIHRQWATQGSLRKPDSSMEAATAFSWKQRAEDYHLVISAVAHGFSAR